MIKKELKLVITFHTTADAMHMEQMCKSKGAAGRIIPVPTSITAGCGLAWCAPLESEDDLRSLIINENLEYQGFHKVMI